MKATNNKPMSDVMQANLGLLPLIMNNIPQAVFWKDRNLVYLGCNQAFADDAGFSSPEDVIGKTDFDMPWKAQAEFYRADDLRVIETNESKLHYEEPQTAPDGSTSWLSTSKIPVHENGQVVAVLGMYEDVTAHRQAENAIHESEERFRRFAEATAEGLVFHEEGRIVDANPAVLAMFGVSDKEKFLGRNMLEFIVPESHKLVMQQMQSDTVLPYEIQCARYDGTIFPVETSTRAYKVGDRVIRASSIRDITERKHAERELQKNQQLLQLVMDNIPQSVFWKEKENLNYLGMNQAFAEDAGFASPQELVGKDDFDMPWKEQAELYRADDQRVLDIGEAKLNYEESQTGPTGQVTWLRTSKIPMRDTDGQVFAVLGMYEDITERKQLETQIQETLEKRGYQVQVSTEISQEVAAATELSELFERVVTLTKERLGYYHTQLLRYDPAQDAVVLINGYGETGQRMLDAGHRMPMGSGLIGTAASTGETVMRSTLAEDPDWQPNPLLPETKGEIAVPIKWQDNVLGVLDVQSNQAGALAEDDRLLLEGLCGQIAIAMHSAELVEAVRQNEARLAEALKAARLANWEYDVEKDIFTFNDQFYSIFHTTAEKVDGYQLSSARYAELFVHPDDMEIVGMEIGKALSSTERVYTTTIDHRIRYEDGGVGYITVQLTVERDENGKITRYYGANQDITERKQAETALRVNETRLAEALRAARLGNWEYDFENDLFIFTDDFYSIFRTSAERVGGYKISSAEYSRNFVHPDDAPLVGIEIQKVLDAKDLLFTTHLEHRMIFSDGEVGYIAVNINVERDENGKITRWYGANQDITERKLAEEALRINEARLAEALKVARLAHWEYDVEKDIFIFNDQFYSILHTTAEKVGGYLLSSARYAELFVHPDDMEVVGMEIGKALSSTERVYNTAIDHRILYADGGVGYITVQLTVERDENGKITRYYGANQDITEQRKVQEEMAERLEEIDRLYRGMSHEGWKTYRETADLPTGFMFDQTGTRPVEEVALADENLASVPMKVLGGEVVGTLAVASDPRNPTSTEDIAFIQKVSDQIALALESARLTAQTQSALAQSERLFEASRILTQSANLQELVTAVVTTLDIRAANRALLTTFQYGVSDEIEELTIIGNWWNGTGHEVTPIGTRYPREVMRVMPMFISPTPVFFNDVFHDERVDPTTMELIAKRLNLRSVAVLPLYSANKQIGALVLEGEEPHRFTQEEIRLFSSLAPQIATVVENRRQFEQAQRQAQREATVNAISQKIQSATSVEAVLQIAARELGRAMDASKAVAQLGVYKRNGGNGNDHS